MYFYNYESWIYAKVVETIFEYHLMDEIYDIYNTDDPTEKIVRGWLSRETKVYRVWRADSGEWLFKETEYEQ